MNTWKYVRSIVSGRGLLVLLTALLLVATQAINPALAMPGSGDPTDTDPIGVGNDPQYTPPAGGFSWAMDKRFGPDINRDGMVDYHWIPDGYVNGIFVPAHYDPAYVYPTAWKITFNGCQTGHDYYKTRRNLPDDPIDPYDYDYVWTLDNNTPVISGCRRLLTFTDKTPHTMTLTTTKVSDGAVHTYSKTVQVKDYFIVSIGDSYASGQGNPDIEQVVDYRFPAGWNMITPAKWQDERCMRSANAAPALAALALEASDPHSSVTFISFACTGSTIYTDNYDPILAPDGTPIWGNRGSGILGPQRGEITDVAWGDWDHYIDPQMQQVQEALDATNGQPAARQIDALLISAGGNDMKFAPIMTMCVLFPNCWVNDLAQMKINPVTDTQAYDLYDIVTRAVGEWQGDNPPQLTVPGGYAALGGAINALYPKPAHVYVTQYPDPTINDRGVANEASETNEHHCRMLDDIFWPDPYDVMTDQEAVAGSHHAQTKLNTVIREAVADLANTYLDIDWQFVDGLSVFDVDDNPAVAGKPGLFKGGPDGGPGHGYCADDNWIRRADESELIQGPVNVRALSVGTMHPNYSGQQAIKTRILRYMLPDLTGQAEQTPTFTFSYSSGGLTSQPGLNGWYIRSCDNYGACNYPKVVGRAVATSTIPLIGASTTVNDTGGCSTAGTIPGVSCSTTVDPNTLRNVTYAFEITATGVYRFQFIVQDENGRVSFLQKEIKVDLEDPVLATPIGPFEVNAGGSVPLSAHITTILVGDPPQEVPSNDDMVVNFDWDLDNDGVFETEDEQPAFSAAEIDGPSTQPVRVMVTDRAGRTATAQAEVHVLYVGPPVTINGAPATSPEGTAINLTSTVNSTLAAPFTYAWEVKKNGVIYVTGAEAGVSLFPNDNGSYEVSLAVTKDGVSVGTASLTIDVTNVAPALDEVNYSLGTVNEGGSLTVSGGIGDPGTKDTLTLEINWGDGSLADTQQLAAGTYTFTASHIYADDNPTGTASDQNAITVKITDKDGASNSDTGEVTAANLAPSLTISAPENAALSAVNAAVNLSAMLTDPSSLDTLTCSVNWDDGATQSGTLAAGVCTASHVYTATGVYTIQVTVTDDDTGSKTESVMAVVYDPSAGFVTGGGWIDSPAGAYTPDSSLAGRAGFGFVSKYQKGANVPSGGTEFQFYSASFYFESEAYDWLVVAGARAQFKGTGAVNGVSGYHFLLTLTDGQVTGGGGVDKFRIKIWDDNGVIYDNLIDAPEDMDSANPQAIGGGSIVIHNNNK